MAILEHEECNRAGLFKNIVKRATTLYSWLYCSCVTIMILFNCVVSKSAFLNRRIWRNCDTLNAGDNPVVPRGKRERF